MRLRYLLGLALSGLLACAGAPDPETAALGPRGDSRTVTVADLSGATQLDLLQFLMAERPNWLRTPEGRPAAVIVYLGTVRLGGPATLREVSLRDVAMVRYFDAAEAQQRFTGRDAVPVIQVVARQAP